MSSDTNKSKPMNFDTSTPNPNDSDSSKPDTSTSNPNHNQSDSSKLKSLFEFLKKVKWKNWFQLIKRIIFFLGVAAIGAFCINIGLDTSTKDSWWQAGTLALLVGIIGTLVPIIWRFLVFQDLFPSGDWFDTSEELIEFRSRLISHYTRIEGTLKFWKTKAAAHQRLYNAQVLWATLSGVALPVLVQYFHKSTHWPTLFLTILTTWNGVLLALSFTLNSRELYRGFRQQESDFYDESRRLLNAARSDDPELPDKVEKYIELVASIRRVGRRIETGTPPSALDI